MTTLAIPASQHSNEAMITHRRDYDGRFIDEATSDPRRQTLGAGTSGVQADQKPVPIGQQQVSKRLNFRITNMKTGKEEIHDPSKHFLDPVKHHPDHAEKALADFEEHAKATEMPTEQFHMGHHSVSHTFKAAKFATRSGSGIQHGDHIYHPNNMDAKRALWKQRKGYIRPLVDLGNGNVHMDMSEMERKDHKLGKIDYNWATGETVSSNRWKDLKRQNRRQDRDRRGMVITTRWLNVGADRRQRAAQQHPPGAPSRQVHGISQVPRPEHIDAKPTRL